MKDYFYIDYNNQQHGPYSALGLQDAGVQPDMLVWCRGMNDWAPAGSIPELAAFLMPLAGRGGGGTPPQPPFTTVDANQHAQNMPPSCPDSYMLWSIFTTLCCCLPFGLLALYYSSRVTTFYVHGYYAKAVEQSAKAKTWCLVGTFIGVITWGAFSSTAFMGFLHLCI